MLWKYSIVSHTLPQEDRNERIFEASVTGEVITTLIARACVNLLTDCLLSISPKFSALADSSVRDAVHALLSARELQRKVGQLHYIAHVWVLMGHVRPSMTKGRRRVRR